MLFKILCGQFLLILEDCQLSDFVLSSEDGYLIISVADNGIYKYYRKYNLKQNLTDYLPELNIEIR